MDISVKEPITVDFVDFWPGFERTSNFLLDILSKYYDMRLDENPEFIIYSCFGNSFRKYKNSVKIFFSGENVLPNFFECDYALSYSYINSKRHSRFPVYLGLDGMCKYIARYESYKITANQLENHRNITKDVLEKKKEFCSFVYNKPTCEHRNIFLKKLSEYKKVNSGGRHLNNIGGKPVSEKKLDFLKKHKFDISFENSSFPGYTTEKIIDAYLAEAAPIYWGNELIGREFNKKAFICVHDFKNVDAVIRRIKELDNDDHQLLSMLNQPLLKCDQGNAYYKREEDIKDFFGLIFQSKINKSVVFDFNYWRHFLLRGFLKSLWPYMPGLLRRTVKPLLCSIDLTKIT